MTIAVDFDGVIHAYSRGWQDGTIYDEPMPGAIDGLHELMRRDAVFIHTSRDPQAVALWITNRLGITSTWEMEGARPHEFWNDRGRVLVTNRKLPATVYIDDRGLHFDSWEQVMADLVTPESD
ncbi:hypothetical protein [Streptomyces sp. OR43]|uniref:hypothetical protein n=1 Tax=Streptomyces sp. or43 TaxID=2478957 RepID=UPI0011CD8218|nr:hypothetical protein [Streptomyces sp. or43]TXS40092.1 hypothetical protein EAO72_16870 [Streptomyces sp. or43]